MGSEMALRYLGCLTPWGQHLLFYQIETDEDLTKLARRQPHTELTLCFQVSSLQARETAGWVKCPLCHHQ